MALLRSILFTLVFYAGSVFWVLSALIGGAFGPRGLAWGVLGWARWHRLCAKTLVGVRPKSRAAFRPGP
jgi:1-acyl-sn-glycerol-3-phosphate acyltransferase